MLNLYKRKKEKKKTWLGYLTNLIKFNKFKSTVIPTINLTRTSLGFTETQEPGKQYLHI